METFFWAIVLSVLACMVHALIKGRYDLIRGGAPIAAVAALIAAIFAVT